MKMPLTESMAFSILVIMLESWKEKELEEQKKADAIKDYILSLGFEEVRGYTLSHGTYSWVCKLKGYPKFFAKYTGGHSYDSNKIILYPQYGKASSMRTFYVDAINLDMVKEWAKEHIKTCKEKQAKIRIWRAAADFVEKDENKDDEQRPDN